MKILVMGGTQFVGRHFVEAALAEGHELTLFHRGKTGADLFPSCEHRHGDRLTDLSELQTGLWDATVDVSAYIPRAVKMLGEVLKGRGGRFVQVSTISVYDPLGQTELHEDSPKSNIEDPTTETVNAETYGALKYLCELEAAKHFEVPAFVRPTIVIGPYDHTNRFHRWVRRIRNGEAIALPKRPATLSPAPFQWIDGRDLGAFMLSLVKSNLAGPFNAVSDGIPMRTALQEAGRALGKEIEIGQCEEELDPIEYPLIQSSDGLRDAMFKVSNTRSKDSGLISRSLAESVKAIAEEIDRSK